MGVLRPAPAAVGMGRVGWGVAAHYAPRSIPSKFVTCHVAVEGSSPR